MKRYGIDPCNSGQRMDELLAALKSLWGGADGYDGQLIKIRGNVLPQPFTPGGPPILVGGTKRRSAERAAELGAGWYGATQYRFERVQAQAERYLARCRALGQPGGMVAVNRTAFVAETDALARREGAPYVAEVMNFYASFASILDAAGKPVPMNSDFVSVLDDNLIFVGSPDTVAASVARYVAAGVNLFNLRIAMGDMPIELAERTVRLLGERCCRGFPDQPD